MQVFFKLLHIVSIPQLQQNDWSYNKESVELIPFIYTKVVE